MEEEINSFEADIIRDYIEQLDKEIREYDTQKESSKLADIIVIIIEVLKSKIPELENGVELKNNAEKRDAEIVSGILKLYLAGKGISAIPFNV